MNYTLTSEKTLKMLSQKRYKILEKNLYFYSNEIISFPHSVD